MKIWIDLDNTPHVPFFKPIVRELEQRGHSVTLTGRDAFQVRDLAAKMGLPCKMIGKHYGKNRFMKIWGLGWRTMQLLPTVLRNRPALALSHGSRSQILLCNLLRIPTVMIMDYEHAETPLLLRPRWEIVPEIMFNESLQCKNRDKIRAYPGIKEDVYAPDFKPDASLAKQLGVDDAEIVVTARPPATEAHYHNPESEILFTEFMNIICGVSGAKVVLLPRNKAQEAQLRESHGEWFKGGKVIVPKGAVDGMNLLWASDLVVSGGGTMNREAAALGVPVYSIFRGPIGAVDKQLQKEGRLTLIESVEQVRSKISIQPRKKSTQMEEKPRNALRQIVDHVEEILGREHATGDVVPSLILENQHGSKT